MCLVSLLHLNDDRHMKMYTFIYLLHIRILNILINIYCFSFQLPNQLFVIQEINLCAIIIIYSKCIINIIKMCPTFELNLMHFKSKNKYNYVICVIAMALLQFTTNEICGM